MQSETLVGHTIGDLLSLVTTLLENGEITVTTPIAMSSDAEGNSYKWLVAYDVDSTRYSKDQFPWSLFEEDSRVRPAHATPQPMLVLYPAD